MRQVRFYIGRLLSSKASGTTWNRKLDYYLKLHEIEVQHPEKNGKTMQGTLAKS